MRLKLGALMMTLLLLLAGCGGETMQEDRGTQLRRYYTGLTSFSAQAEITADYGERVYRYTVSAEGTLTEGTLTVLSPESVAGAGFGWTESGGHIDYDGVSLETGELSPDGLSPADAMPMLLNALTTGRLISSGEERLEGEDTVVLELANPTYPDAESTVSLWLAQEDGALRRAEICWEGERVITCAFSDFTFTYDTPAQSG